MLCLLDVSLPSGKSLFLSWGNAYISQWCGGELQSAVGLTLGIGTADSMGKTSAVGPSICGWVLQTFPLFCASCFQISHCLFRVISKLLCRCFLSWQAYHYNSTILISTCPIVLKIPQKKEIMAVLCSLILCILNDPLMGFVFGLLSVKERSGVWILLCC